MQACVNVFTILSRMKFKKDWHERNCKKKRQNDVGQITDFDYCTKRVGEGFKHDSRIKSCLVWRVCYTTGLDQNMSYIPSVFIFVLNIGLFRSSHVINHTLD